MQPYMQALVEAKHLGLFADIEYVMHNMPEVDLGADARGDCKKVK